MRFRQRFALAGAWESVVALADASAQDRFLVRRIEIARAGSEKTTTLRGSGRRPG
jgi:hypothetical protein